MTVNSVAISLLGEALTRCEPPARPTAPQSPSPPNAAAMERLW